MAHSDQLHLTHAAVVEGCVVLKDRKGSKFSHRNSLPQLCTCITWRLSKTALNCKLIRKIKNEQEEAGNDLFIKI